ncbi:MAG: HU family DNA-binding protein [Trueperaceae bacterium]|nr:HU family DNA-binding protein [Trueperaceae bacterium]
MAGTKSISKAELVELIAKNTRLDKSDVQTVVDEMITQVSDHLDRDYQVHLSDFGTFESRERRGRVWAKPGTRERIEVPASRYAAFRPSRRRLSP